MLIGAGPSFCAGADISHMKKSAKFSRKQNYEARAHGCSMFHTLHVVNKPTIACIRGAVRGGGVRARGCVRHCDRSANGHVSLVGGQARHRSGHDQPVRHRRDRRTHGPALHGHGRGVRFARRRTASASSTTSSKMRELNARVGVMLTQLYCERSEGDRSGQGPDRHGRSRPHRRNAIGSETSRRIADIRATPEAQEGLSAFLEKRQAGMACTALSRNANSRAKDASELNPMSVADQQVKIVEVGPRDGLQNEAADRVPTAVKIELIDRLADAGLPVIEATAFVSPKWVPQMADNARRHGRHPRASPVSRYPVLVPNRKGLDAAHRRRRATKSSCSAPRPKRSRKRNTNCSIDEGARALFRSLRRRRLRTRVAGARRRSRSCLGCPYEGEVEARSVVARCARALMRWAVTKSRIARHDRRRHAGQDARGDRSRREAHSGRSARGPFPRYVRAGGRQHAMPRSSAASPRSTARSRAWAAARTRKVRPATSRPKTCCTCWTASASRPASIWQADGAPAISSAARSAARRSRAWRARFAAKTKRHEWRRRAIAVRQRSASSTRHSDYLPRLLAARSTRFRSGRATRAAEIRAARRTRAAQSAQSFSASRAIT